MAKEEYIYHSKEHGKDTLFEVNECDGIITVSKINIELFKTMRNRDIAVVLTDMASMVKGKAMIILMENKIGSQ